MKIARRFDDIRKLVPSVATALFFCLLASPVTAEASWTLEASALGELNDNVVNKLGLIPTRFYHVPTIF